MAVITSAGTGNFSAGATWVGGIVPTSVDTVVLTSTHVVTADVDFTIAGLSVSGFVAYLHIATTRSVNLGTVTHNNQSSIVRITANNPNVVTITATASGYVAPTAGSYNSPAAIEKVSGDCQLIFNGVLTGGRNDDPNLSAALRISASAANSVINITGVVQGTNQVTAATNVNGGLYCAANNCTITINGISQGRVGMAVRNTGTSTINASGSISASTTSHAIVSTALVRVDGVVTNTGTKMAVYAPNITVSSLASTRWLFQTNDALIDKYLYTADELTGYPLEAKVENGEVYGPSSEFTGTLDPVTISAGQVADISNAIALHITPQVLSAITGLP